MSTDLRDRTTHPSPDQDGGAEKPKSSLSFTQVVGGALAAMTAAAIGSRLSLAGTVVGAALASVVAAVAGAVYTASLRRTTKHVTKVIQKTRTYTGDAGGTASAAPADPVWDDPAGTVNERDRPTQVLPAAETGAATTPQPTRRPIGWKRVLVGALLMFVIAALALTGLELATGHALSGGSGTTVGQVAQGRSTPSAKPSASPTSASPSATPSATATSSATPSTTPSSEPSATPSASASATPSPTSTPTATPSLPAAVPSGATTP